MLYAELRVAHLDKILELEQCKLIYKIINGRQKSNTNFNFTSQIHYHFTRSQNNIYPVYSRTDIALNCPMQSASRAYNRLPVEIRSKQYYNSFLYRLKQHLNI